MSKYGLIINLVKEIEKEEDDRDERMEVLESQVAYLMERDSEFEIEIDDIEEIEEKE